MANPRNHPFNQNFLLQSTRALATLIFAAILLTTVAIVAYAIPFIVIPLLVLIACAMINTRTSSTRGNTTYVTPNRGVCYLNTPAYGGVRNRQGRHTHGHG